MPRSLFAKRPWAELHDALRNGGDVLIGLDLDGTLAPIADHPERANVLPRVLRLLQASVRARKTRVAIVSARPLTAMRRLLPVSGLHRVAQYGLEGSGAPSAKRRAAWRRHAADLALGAARGVAKIPGAWVETKGMTVAIHDRAVAPSRRRELALVVRRLVSDARARGFRPQIGRRVVDLVPAGFDKGTALRGVIRAFRPETTLYLGDSPADECAFRVLGAGDFAIRVGSGPTRAPFRVAGPDDVARVLGAVVRLRAGAPSTPRR